MPRCFTRRWDRPVSEDQEADPEHLSWRVPRWLPLLKIGAAVVFALVGPLLSSGDTLIVILAYVIAAGFAIYASRDLVAPVRLRADPDGVTVVTGFGRNQRFAWADVDRIRMDSRRRLFGLTNTMLEIDADDRLFLYGRYDLDADSDDVVKTLNRLKNAAT